MSAAASAARGRVIVVGSLNVDRLWRVPRLPVAGETLHATATRVEFGGKGAAFAATVLMRLQDEPVDMTNFYTADTSAWSMFGQFGIRTPVYHAFRAFDRLAKHPRRVACDVAATDSKPGATAACAASIPASTSASLPVGIRTLLTGV